MKRRNLFVAIALGLLSNALPRLIRAQPSGLNLDERELIAAISDVVLPTALGAAGRAKAADAFVQWLDEYRAGVPKSYGYGSELRYAIVPPSPLPKYRLQFRRLKDLSKSRGPSFVALAPADRQAVIELALLEAKVTELPERPDGRHIASDLLGHFYSSSEGNDFLFNASIRSSYCRGLNSSSDRPESIT